MTIEIYDGCFGPTVTIDGKSVHVDSQNRELDRIEEQAAKRALLDSLESIKDHLDVYDWKAIAEIITNRLPMDSVEDTESYCEQCGSYNTYCKYKI